MHHVKSLNEILEINDCNELVSEFYFFVSDKKSFKLELNKIEEVAYLLLSMLPSIEMDSILDLFHQLYSLDECVVVEKSLRQFELNKLADLFNEAKSIFINNKSNITQEEYKQIDLGTINENQDRRLDEISKMILAKDSEIYRLGDCLCKFIKSNSEVLMKSNTRVNS